MKKIQFLAAFLFTGLLLTSCDDNDNPIAINEEEVITTLTATLTPVGGGTAITLQTRDLDGDGPNAPVVTVSGNLMAGAVYNGTLVLLNETLNPAEDITEEVEEESDEHQFFFTIGGLDATAVSTNNDGNGNPLGTMFTLTAGAASTGTLTFTLRHEPKKPNTGLADAGGETDISATFNLVIQ
ncbi:MAG: type 1 periplasmic binding fold superfamily protein [Cellulophaga sp.]|nr:type 1 periplasmic binding fold superfamily protein [Cellulophaga sp.]